MPSERGHGARRGLHTVNDKVLKGNRGAHSHLSELANGDPSLSFTSTLTRIRMRDT